MRLVYVIARDNKEEITIPSKESVYYSPYPAYLNVPSSISPNHTSTLVSKFTVTLPKIIRQ